VGQRAPVERIAMSYSNSDEEIAEASVAWRANSLPFMVRTDRVPELSGPCDRGGVRSRATIASAWCPAPRLDIFIAQSMRRWIDG
jgi:hypothetical protein